MKILIVDDDPAIRLLLFTVFGDDHEVSVLCDGHNAVSVLSDPNHQFDVVLLDLKMPRLSGEMVLEFLSGWQNIKTKFIIVSGFSEEAEHLQYSNLVGVLPKPFNIRELVKLVESAAETTSLKPAV
ncbi:response regulator [Candidatus Pelagisphaera phototrophica]|uniref:response regulator n=1 Tax=Candidatus Pelagisphaera phototrophica TaxID=2684113 RepID=UPI001A0FDD39|nr:response regulator [Candidatus Pelagisphaera phototrophica]QXD32282.1 response regulator [Candidatus Pelagisphaera phototrophica]